MKFWASQHFKALQRAWYRRLEESGFEDAEELIAGEMTLRQTAAHVYRDADQLQVESKEAYYHFVAQMVADTVFTSDVDRIILLCHAEGRKTPHIRRELEKIGKQRDRNTIRYRIRLYEMQWGLRHYTPKQLNRKVS